MIKIIAVIAIGFVLFCVIGGLCLITYMAKVQQPRDDREHERLRLQALEEFRQTKG